MKHNPNDKECTNKDHEVPHKEFNGRSFHEQIKYESASDERFVAPQPPVEDGDKQDWEQDFRTAWWAWEGDKPVTVDVAVVWMRNIIAEERAKGREEGNRGDYGRKMYQNGYREGSREEREKANEVSSLTGEDDKIFSRVVAKCFEAPFPEVAVQHAIIKVHERATKQALAAEHERLKVLVEARIKKYTDHTCFLNDFPQTCDCYRAALLYFKALLTHNKNEHEK